MSKMQEVVRLIVTPLLIILIGVGCAPRAEEETDEPEPTATETDVPTDTPPPTETDTPEPTETDTPEPTETDAPEPTETATRASSSSSGSGTGSGSGSQATSPPPSATTGSSQPAATTVPPTAIPATFTPVPAATQAPPDTSGLGTFYLRSQTVNSATCAMSVWGNGIEFVVDAPATVPLPSGVYGWQAFLGIGQTSPAEMFLPAGGVCSFTCYDEYIEWFCQ